MRMCVKKLLTNAPGISLPRDAVVHSAVLRLHVVRPSVRLSVRLWRWWIRIT